MVRVIKDAVENFSNSAAVKFSTLLKTAARTSRPIPAAVRDARKLTAREAITAITATKSMLPPVLRMYWFWFFSMSIPRRWYSMATDETLN